MDIAQKTIVLLSLFQTGYSEPRAWMNNNYPRPPWANTWSGGYGGQYHGIQQQASPIGTLWQTEWFPASMIKGSLKKKNFDYPPFDANARLSDAEHRDYIRQFIPGLYDRRPQPQNYWPQPPNYNWPQQPQQPWPPQAPPRYPPPGAAYPRPPVAPYPNPPGAPYPNPQGYPRNPYDQDPRYFPEVVAHCDRRYCYLSCRMKLLGGGRCTKGGCMCYVSFFDHNGRPTSQIYDEDSTWFELTEQERQMIRDTIAADRPEPGPQTSRPPYVHPTNPPHTHHTARPPYRTTSRPNYIGGGGFYFPATSKPDFNGGGGFFEPATSKPDFNGGGGFFEPATSRPNFNNGGGDYGSGFDESYDEDDTEEDDFFGSDDSGDSSWY